MAFTPETLHVAVDTIGGGSLRMHFYRTNDDEETFTAQGYFADVASRGLREGDLMVIYSSALGADGGAVVAEVAELLNGSASVTVNRNYVQEFADEGAIEAAHVPAILEVIRTQGQDEAGDGRGAYYKRVAGPADVQSADGTWWERIEDQWIADSVTEAEGYATEAEGYATAAGSSATAAEGSATAAATSATNAANSASAAADSETAAGNSASAASVDATAAGSSATAAEGSATAAATSATEAAADADAAEAAVAGLAAIMAEHRQVPSGFLNARFLQLPSYRIRLVAQEYNIYNAFPGGLRRFGDDIVAIYSSGSGHSVTDRQRYVRSDTQFQTIDTGTFLLNSPVTYDNDFLEGLLAGGESHNFKSVFTVKNVAGTLTNFTTSVVTVTDPYALWGSPVFIGDRWYTTGYRTSGGYRRPALFESTDGMETWDFVVLISTANTKELSETALVECANGDWLAIIRNDTDPGDRALDVSRSTDGGATWSVPSTLSGMKGTQPHILKLTNGDLLLFCGDRTGSSGLDNAGNATDNDDITGIAFWKSTDNGLTWSTTKMLAPSWSTDCGQPLAVELADGTVGVMCYLAPGATNGARGVETGIYWIEFDPSGL